MKDIKKHELHYKMTDAIYDCKFGNGTKEAARNATEAFAGYCGITYERAYDIAMEVFI